MAYIMIFRESKWKRITLSAAGIFAFIIIFEIIPVYNELLSNVFEYFEIKSNYESSLINKVSAPELEIRNNNIKREINSILGGDQSNHNLSGIILKLNDIANEVNIQISSINPQQLKQKDKLLSQEIEIIFKSRFENIYNFVSKIEKLNQVILFKEISILPVNKFKQDLEFKSVIEVYFNL